MRVAVGLIVVGALIFAMVASVLRLLSGEGGGFDVISCSLTGIALVLLATRRFLFAGRTEKSAKGHPGEFDEAQRQLLQSDKLASLGILVAGIAHEINNPNHTIRSTATLVTAAWREIEPILAEYHAENGSFSVAGMEYEEIQELMPVYLENLSTASRKIEMIVGGLRDYAKTDVYDMRERIDLNDVVAAAVSISQSMIRRATDFFSVVYVDGPLPVKGNFQRLEQVAVNLIQNSCHALRDPSESLTVSTGRKADGACFIVEDAGKGIAAEKLGRISDPFYTTNREKGGRGLGLAIANAIVDEHQGKMIFSSESGSGTKVVVCLPRLEDLHP